MKIKDILINYDDNNKYLEELNASKENRIKSFIFGYFIALMIVLSPIIICAHFFIYKFYFELIIFIISLLFVTFLTLGEIIHHKFLVYFSNVTEKRSLKLTYIIDTLMYLLICLIFFVVIVILF